MEEIRQRRVENRLTNEANREDLNLSYAKLYNENNIVDHANALNGAIISKKWNNNTEVLVTSVESFYQFFVGVDLKKHIEKQLDESNIKGQIIIFARFKNIIHDGPKQAINYMSLPIKSRIYIFTPGNDIN